MDNMFVRPDSALGSGTAVVLGTVVLLQKANVCNLGVFVDPVLLLPVVTRMQPFREKEDLIHFSCPC